MTSHKEGNYKQLQAAQGTLFTGIIPWAILYVYYACD